MVPSSWLSVVLFLLLVAPGLLFDLLALQRRIGPSESTFREIGRVVLASLVLTVAAALILRLIAFARPRWLPNAKALANHPTVYSQAHGELVIGTVLMVSGLACLMALLVHLCLTKRESTATLSFSSGWSAVFRRDRVAGFAPYARVRLVNGNVYSGTVADYSANLDLADREIVLAPPLWFRTPGGEHLPIPETLQRLVLHGPSIESIGVEYRPSYAPRSDKA
jgi:hypothetical protein